MKEKIKFQSTQTVFAEENSKEISVIAEKRGIKIPSSHLGFFKTVYAKIEEANLNSIRLSAKAVDEALPGLIGSQVNFEHMGAGFLCGTILDAWVNESDEIEVMYSFFKSIYPDEYETSIELAKEGELAVSFELLSERDSQEFLADGTIRLHDIDFQGMGHLMDNPPACPQAKIYEFASKCKKRLSNVEDRELVFASKIEEQCDLILKADKWTSDIYNNFPDSSFAVIEPAYADGVSGDRKARHLAFKDRNGRVDLTNYRIALDKVDEILPITDSITTEELRKLAKEELDKYTEILANRNDESDKLNQGGNTNMEFTEEQKTKIEDLRAELGDLAKDVSDEDLLDEIKVAELQDAKSAKQKEEIAYKVDSVEIRTFSLEEEDGVEKVVETIEIVTIRDYNAMKEAQAKAGDLETKVAELESTLEAKNSEIETVRENAETIGKTKVQLQDNEYANDFSDEDYLDEEKVEKAIQDQKNAETVAERKEELKDNEYATDFTDEDYLNDVKVELAKVKKEKDELKAKVPAEEINASEEEEEEDEPEMDTGDSESESDSETVMASIRKDNTNHRGTQKVYERK